MKKTLAYDRNARQFKTDVDGKRFYLGTDATEAEDRKRKIVRYAIPSERLLLLLPSGVAR